MDIGFYHNQSISFFFFSRWILDFYHNQSLLQRAKSDDNSEDEDYLPSKDRVNYEEDEEDDEALFEMDPEVGLHLEMELEEEDGPIIVEFVACPRSAQAPANPFLVGSGP